MADENCSKTLKLPKTQACAPATNQYRCDAKNGQSAGRRRARRTDEAVAAAPNDSVCTAKAAASGAATVPERTASGAAAARPAHLHGDQIQALSP